MPSTPSLIQKLRSDYPNLSFTRGDDFYWSFKNRAITYTTTDLDTSAHVLHELSHALLMHQDYTRDIELIGFERDAWAYAKNILAPRYSQVISSDTIKHSLDTYRDWLHARSTCPTCSATGIEIKKAVYHCLACSEQWHVNEARLCALKRYKTKK